MKASEARELALKEQAANQYPEVIREITEQAKKGNLECWIYHELTSETRRFLIEDGYSVGTTQWEQNECLTKIEW